MPAERVLIVGAGISGSILAYFLAKHDFKVVVVERSKAEQRAGQGLEIEEPALSVVREMGVLRKLEEKKTGELGFNLLDERNRSHALLGVGGPSPTGALELMRGDMCEIYYRAANESPNVTYHFQTTLQGLRQAQDKVTVELRDRSTNATWTEDFDMIVGADGVNSKTRLLTMGSPEQLGCFKTVGAYVSYFSIPKEEQDWPYSRLCHFPDRRIIWTRPLSEDAKTTSACFIYCKDNVPALNTANASGDRQQQKAAWADVYSGLGWEAPRVITHMMATDNFYSDRLMQVKLSKWSQDRVVLLGDSAWAPTPFTGQGNQLAIIGAFVLAQEMARDRSPAAFGAYEARLREYVENAQAIPLGGHGPYLLNPQTRWGIAVLRRLMGLLAWTVRVVTWTGLMRYLPETEKNESFDLQIGKGGEAEGKKER